jgi:hypothetical protein
MPRKFGFLDHLRRSGTEYESSLVEGAFQGRVSSSTESRFSQIRAGLGFAILLIRLNGEWRRRWSMKRKRMKRVLRSLSIP